MADLVNVTTILPRLGFPLKMDHRDIVELLEKYNVPIIHEVKFGAGYLRLVDKKALERETPNLEREATRRRSHQDAGITRRHYRSHHRNPNLPGSKNYHQSDLPQAYVPRQEVLAQLTALRADCLRTRLCIEEIMRSLGLPLPEVPDGIGDPVKLAPKNGGES